MPERITDPAALLPVELQFEGEDLLGTGIGARFQATSASSTYCISAAVVPPSVVGDWVGPPGHSSASMMTVSPMRILA